MGPTLESNDPTANIDPMIPLSRKRTFLTKWVLPYVFTVPVALWQFHEESIKGEPQYVLLGSVWLTVAVILFFVIKRQTNDYPDEVLDAGTFLRVVRGPSHEDYPFADLEAVDTSKLVRVTRLYLHFRTPTKEGRTISFYPLQEKVASGENAVAAALRRKLSRDHAGTRALSS